MDQNTTHIFASVDGHNERTKPVDLSARQTTSLLLSDKNKYYTSYEYES